MSAQPTAPGTPAYFALLGALVVGVVLIALGAWRQGLILIGCALVGGAGVRVVLADDRAGLLKVRGRVFDVVWMALLGAALVTLAFIVPRGGV